MKITPEIVNVFMAGLFVGLVVGLGYEHIRWLNRLHRLGFTAEEVCEMASRNVVWQRPWLNKAGIRHEAPYIFRAEELMDAMAERDCVVILTRLIRTDRANRFHCNVEIAVHGKDTRVIGRYGGTALAALEAACVAALESDPAPRP